MVEVVGKQREVSNVKLLSQTLVANTRSMLFPLRTCDAPTSFSKRQLDQKGSCSYHDIRVRPPRGYV